jgi:hypothetical protein
MFNINLHSRTAKAPVDATSTNKSEEQPIQTTILDNIVDSDDNNGDCKMSGDTTTVEDKERYSGHAIPQCRTSGHKPFTKTSHLRSLTTSCSTSTNNSNYHSGRTINI